MDESSMYAQPPQPPKKPAINTSKVAPSIDVDVVVVVVVDVSRAEFIPGSSLTGTRKSRRALSASVSRR